MSGIKTGSPARIALAILVVVALVGAAVGITIWRYDHALGKASAAQVSTTEQYSSQKAATAFWNQREAMNEYLLIKDPQLLDEVENQRVIFARLKDELPPGADQDAEARLIDRAITANDAYAAAFHSLRGRPNAALARLNELEASVTGPIDRLKSHQAREVAGDRRDAAGAKHQALIAGLLGGLIALIGIAAFAFAALRLIRRTSAREARLDALVVQTRSSIGALGEVAQDLRSAAQEAEASTAEQSAAITETSAT